LQKKFYDISAKLYQNSQTDPNDPSNYQDAGDTVYNNDVNFDSDDDDDYVNTEFKDE